MHMQGFLNWSLPIWIRRLVTRSVALVPAIIGVLVFGDRGATQLLVISQVRHFYLFSIYLSVYLTDLLSGNSIATATICHSTIDSFRLF